MNFKYHNLPFGAQLLLWTSRLAVNGSCRSNPNKYVLIDIAYKKVGINNGCELLKKYLSFLKAEKKINLQPICSQHLINSEISLIDCIEEHKKDYINNEYFIKIWQLDNTVKLFTDSAKNLAMAYKKANLDTNLELLKVYQNKSKGKGGVRGGYGIGKFIK